MTISSEGEKFVFIGDALFEKPDQMQDPGWPRPSETDPLEAFYSRVAPTKILAANGYLVLSFHGEFP